MIIVKNIASSIEAELSKDSHMGLSGRESLEGGMVFQFEMESLFPFQMQNTLVPLSIAFINKSNIIVDIQDMDSFSKELCFSDLPFICALEVNQGYFDENNIEVGDSVGFEKCDENKYTISFIKEGDATGIQVPEEGEEIEQEQESDEEKRKESRGELPQFNNEAIERPG